MRIFTLLFPFFIFYLINNSAGTSNNGNILEETKSSSSEEENIADGNSVDENENRQDSTFPWTFKNFEQLTSTNETWPTTGFYRFMSICQEETAPFNLYKQEGQQCPHGTPVAIGRYRNAQNETGWGIIEVETFAPFPQHVQAYAAGLVEGALTKVQIFNHYRNTVQGMCDNNATEYCTRLFRYLNANLQWIQSQTFIQLTGINDGYMSNKIGGYTPHSSFKISPVFLLQLLGEFYDLEIALGKKTAKRGAGHCSALIKVTDGNKDLLVAHNTMAGYNQMNRMVKLYKFGYDKKEVPGNTVSFSGYPAVLASQDDFTLTSAKLVSIETTISIFNASLYQLYLKPVGQLQCWIRSYISNQLAATAHDWVKIFAQYNSGTYNNQWTVVDYKLFKPGKELPNANLVWILEQVPGTCVSRDLTWFLRKYGYWPSYNIPYLNKISQLSGYNHQGNLNNWWRWGHSPRARIFQRDQSKVDGMPALQALLRYNDFKHDEFSRCNCSPPYTADASIATRGDLNPPNGHWELPDEQGYHNFGSLDYKGTNYELANKLRFELIGGPTYGGPGNLPIFSWATTQLKVPHFGQKTEWNFESFVTLWQKSTNTN